jgi:hypothetical protein
MERVGRIGSEDPAQVSIFKLNKTNNVVKFLSFVLYFHTCDATYDVSHSVLFLVFYGRIYHTAFVSHVFLYFFNFILFTDLFVQE